MKYWKGLAVGVQNTALSRGSPACACGRDHPGEADGRAGSSAGGAGQALQMLRGGAGALHGLRGETHSLGLLAGRLLRVPSFLPRTAFRLGVEEASSFSSRAAAIPTQAGSFTGF